MAKSAVQRKATERQRKREQGLVPVEVWIRPEHKGKLKEFEREHGNLSECSLEQKTVDKMNN